MNVGDKVTWEKHHYYIMDVCYGNNKYYRISKPNKHGTKPKVIRVDKLDIAYKKDGYDN